MLKQYGGVTLNEIDVQFTCPDCDEKFSFSIGHILEKESLSCPKCGCVVSEDELSHLKIAINYMESNPPN